MEQSALSIVSFLLKGEWKMAIGSIMRSKDITIKLLLARMHLCHGGSSSRTQEQP